MKKDNLKYYIVLVVILTPVSYFNIIIHKNAQSAGRSQFGSSRERIAAANAANVQYAGRQRVIITRKTAVSL